VRGLQKTDGDNIGEVGERVLPCFDQLFLRLVVV